MFGGGFLSNNNAGGGFGGGGFGNGGGNGFGGNQDYLQNSATKGNANASPFKGERDRKKGSIIPLTIKTILEVTNRVDDVIEVDGVPVDQAVVLGRVYKMEEQSTRTIFHLDDTTGRIQVAYYKKSDSTSNGALDNLYYTENMYLKAVVMVKPFKAQKMFVSNMLQTVTDYNQVSYHFLSTFLAAAYRLKGPLPKADPNFQSNTTQQQNQGNNDMMNQSNNSYQPLGSMGGGANQSPEMIIKNAIDMIQKHTQNGLCRLSKLHQYIKGRVDPKHITNYLTMLEARGEIFSDQDPSDPGYGLLGN